MPSTGPRLAPEVAADDADVGAVVVGDFGDFGGFDFLIAGRGHLERGGEIGPELEAVHAAGVVALGHFLVDDAAAGGHPLDVAGGDGAVVAHAVAVLDGAGEDVGDGFDAAMRMPGEAGEVVVGDVVAEIVEEEEGIEVGGVAEAEGAAEVDAGAFEGGLGFDESLYGSNGHDVLQRAPRRSVRLGGRGVICGESLRAALDATLRCVIGIKRRSEGAETMDAGNETAAAILVQTIFLRDGHLQGLLGEQAKKGAVAAAEFLKPYYRAVLAMTLNERTEGL